MYCKLQEHLDQCFYSLQLSPAADCNDHDMECREYESWSSAWAAANDMEDTDVEEVSNLYTRCSRLAGLHLAYVQAGRLDNLDDVSTALHEVSSHACLQWLQADTGVLASPSKTKSE